MLCMWRGITTSAIKEIVRQAAAIHDEHLQRAGAVAHWHAGRVGGRRPGDRDDAAVAVGLEEGSASSDEIAWAARLLLVLPARRRPLLVLIDDVQWAEQMPAGAAAPARPRGRRADLDRLVPRPEFVAGRWGWDADLQLQPLPSVACESLIEELLPSHDELRARVLSRAGGNPLFLEELAARRCESREG